MATLQLIHDRRGIEKDSTPSTLRMIIRHKKTSASISLDVPLTKKQWNGKAVINHPNDKQLNAVVKKRSSEIETAFYMLTLSGDERYKSAAEIKEAILDKLNPDRETAREQQSKDKHLFIPYYIEFKEKRRSEGTASVYDRALKWIRKYDADIESKSIEVLDRKWLEGLDKAMSATNKKNTRSILLRSVRAVFSHAL